MRFTFDGKTYQITFSREFKLVRNPFWIGVKDAPFSEAEPEFIKSQWPYTTVRLDVVEQNDPTHPDRWHAVELYRTATVGYYHRERSKFSIEQGRIHALHSLMTTIPAGMVAPLWSAYNTRPKGQPIRRQEAA